MMEERLLQDCTLCPRQCHVNRISGKKGYGMDTRKRAAGPPSYVGGTQHSEKKVLVQYFFPAAGCDAAFARTGT